MKIAHVVFGLRLGGIETMLAAIVREQVALGHDVTVFVVNDLVDPSVVGLFPPEAQIVKLGRRPGSKNPAILLRLALRLRRLNPDVVHLHDHRLRPYVMLSGLRRLTVLTFHASFPRRGDVGAEVARNCRYPRHVCAISKYVAADIARNIPIEPIVVENGIVVDNFVVRRPFDKPVRRLVQVGRLDMDKKGHDILIRALALCRDRGLDLSLDIVGDGADRDRIADCIARAGVADRVAMLGARDHDWIRAHLADYDMLAQPSRDEGFGLTVAEAMAAGLPVLVSDQEGPAEVIDYGSYGFMFATGSVEACGNALAAVAATAPADLNAMAAKARERVADRYDIAATARAYLDLYSKL